MDNLKNGNSIIGLLVLDCFVAEDTSQEKVIKILVAVSHSGDITFVSKDYFEEVTFSQILRKSEFLKVLKPNDTVITQKNVSQLVRDVPQCEALVFKQARNNFAQFGPAEKFKEKDISRIHANLDRVLSLLKSFKVLNSISSDKSTLIQITKIALVVAFLCNNMSDV
jgi:hypothetical protein